MDLVQISEVYDMVDVGVTCPIRGRLSDGSVAYIKYPHNPCGNIVLINEYIGYSMAQALRITIPEFGICLLKEDVIAPINGEIFDALDASNCGYCFYTKAIEKSVPFSAALTSTHSLIKNRDVENIILLDCILNNTDRHRGNLLFDFDSCQVYTIDFSHWGQTGSSVLKCNEKIYNELCRWFGFDRESLITVSNIAKDTFTIDWLINLEKSIPEEWLKAVECGRIKTLFSVIKGRIDSLPEICAEIIANRREYNG